MSIPAKDGAWLSITDVARLDCSECGVVLTTRWHMNDREADELIRQHAREKHGGVKR